MKKRSAKLKKFGLTLVGLSAVMSGSVLAAEDSQAGLGNKEASALAMPIRENALAQPSASSMTPAATATSNHSTPNTQTEAAKEIKSDVKEAAKADSLLTKPTLSAKVDEMAAIPAIVAESKEIKEIAAHDITAKVEAKDLEAGKTLELGKTVANDSQQAVVNLQGKHGNELAAATTMRKDKEKVVVKEGSQTKSQVKNQPVKKGHKVTKVTHYIEAHAMTKQYHRKAKVMTEGGITVYQTEDKSFWFNIGGRLNIDSTLFSGSQQDKPSYAPFPSGSQIRRAFLKFYGGVGDCFNYNLTFAFNGLYTGFEDAWIGYTGVENTNFRVGQFTPPTTIDDWGNYGTVNDTMFLESALATKAFAVPTKALGLWVDTHFADLFMVSAAIYHPEQPTFKYTGSTSLLVDVDTNNSVTNFGNPNRSDRFGASARLVFSPIHRDCQVFHLGVMGRYQALNTMAAFGSAGAVQPLSFFTTPEATARNNFALVNTGSIRAKSYNVVAGEALAISGPLTVEAEFFQTNVQQLPTFLASQAPNLVNEFSEYAPVHFQGWHVQAGWVLTGESRGYDVATGTLRNPIPESLCGAWEIAARYSTVNLINKNIYGGKEFNATVGLRWFMNEHVNLAFNYIRANIYPTGVPAGGRIFAVATGGEFDGLNPFPTLDKRKLNIFGLRLGVAF